MTDPDVAVLGPAQGQVTAGGVIPDFEAVEGWRHEAQSGQHGLLILFRLRGERRFDTGRGAEEVVAAVGAVPDDLGDLDFRRCIVTGGTDLDVEAESRRPGIDWHLHLTRSQTKPLDLT